ncbi:MAG TPA: ATP-binding cassette domain-containing protein [Candidatus Limnocylindrales bacterium]|nr:ATP-binding cassette domain-containing protein [Candidatus Limnocylindrales bacterium]
MALIRLDHVTKTYRDRVALSDVSLSFDPGEWVFITGPSGAGKSTLLRLVSLAERPTRGRVDAEPGMRRAIGVLGQEFRLLSDRNAYENIALACRISGIWDKEEIRQRVTPLLDEMGLRGMSALFPGELSAGEKQRVALARALVRHPRVLIADEPTGNLDPAAAAQIFSLMRQYRDRETLVLVATHGEDWKQRHPGRVIRLEQGTVRSDAIDPAGEPASGLDTVPRADAAGGL